MQNNNVNLFSKDMATRRKDHYLDMIKNPVLLFAYKIWHNNQDT